MGNEQTKLATNTWATVAIATGVIAFKQAAMDGLPIEFVSVLLGAGLVLALVLAPLAAAAAIRIALG